MLLTRVLSKSIKRAFSGTSSKGASLYIWGNQHNSFGYAPSKTNPVQLAPKKVEGEWDGKVRQTSLGPNHGGFVTSKHSLICS